MPETVDNVDQFYYRRGRLLGIIPTPTEATDSLYTSTGTVSGSTITDSGASYEVNSLYQKLIEIDSSNYVITANTATVITVDGTPATGSQAYTIYDRGIEVWYEQLPDSLSDDTTEVNGEELDHWAIVYGVAARVLETMGQAEKSLLYEAKFQALIEERNKEHQDTHSEPMFMQPWNLRSDLA
jgi:hypothetical protein